MFPLTLNKFSVIKVFVLSCISCKFIVDNRSYACVIKSSFTILFAIFRTIINSKTRYIYHLCKSKSLN